ncbi:MAG: hypothetical protein PHH40_04660 [Candidatus Moranbacteria bacterium]|nr:hypothetical protein [Candidatus Moranbacteria bacterium]MDD3964473.1 hypothetical protein [Candidatus Moranbacteria bacterium]
MAYTFNLKIEKEKSELSLSKDGLVLGKKEWEEGRDMGRRLFQGIADLLAENNLRADEVTDFVIDSEIPDNYTSMRIAETVKRVYTFGVTFSHPVKDSEEGNQK